MATPQPPRTPHNRPQSAPSPTLGNLSLYTWFIITISLSWDEGERPGLGEGGHSVTPHGHGVTPWCPTDPPGVVPPRPGSPPNSWPLSKPTVTPTVPNPAVTPTLLLSPQSRGDPPIFPPSLFPMPRSPPNPRAPLNAWGFPGPT